MSGPDSGDLWEKVLGWLAVADRDERAARICLAADPPLPDVAAYHCQQATEKLPKGLLVSSNIDFRKTHDLDELGVAVVAAFPSAAPMVATAQGWTSWGAVYRYPGEVDSVPEPSAEELAHALDVIADLAVMLRSLGPPPETTKEG